LCVEWGAYVLGREVGRSPIGSRRRAGPRGCLRVGYTARRMAHQSGPGAVLFALECRSSPGVKAMCAGSLSVEVSNARSS
jgi:hypothetical protein